MPAHPPRRCLSRTGTETFEIQMLTSTLNAPHGKLSSAYCIHVGSRPIYASLGLTDYSQVDMLGLRYKLVNFGADKSPGQLNWRVQRV